MNDHLIIQDLSLYSFWIESEDWKTEPSDHVSLNKVSIMLLLNEPNPEHLTFFLRASALKREHTGASKFILWAFVDRPPQKKKHPGSMYRPRHMDFSPEAPEALHGIGCETIKAWVNRRCPNGSLEAPKWDLPLLADFADEFMHLTNHLTQLSQNFDSKFKDSTSTGQLSLEKVIEKSIYFQKKQELISLAKKVMERAAAEHNENPSELLLKAFEGIGVATKRTENVEKVTKRQASASSKSSTSNQASTSGKESASQNSQQLEND
jgi:hypothetical protein